MSQHGISIPVPVVSENGLWFRSPLLGRVPGLLHGFTLRAAGDFANPEIGGMLVAETGARELRLLRQVHGTAVADPGRESAPADAWAGAPEGGTLLGIVTADCLPVLLCHPRSGRLGLAHAGWRGATGGIIGETLKAMGVAAEEILAALGPCIRPCCYEVGEDVALAARRSRAPFDFLWPSAGGTYRFDLAAFAKAELLEAGVSPESIDCLSCCTACRPDLFFSFRKEGPTGRLLSFLGWRKRP
ncbi:MAG: laccase domain-containing protein [Deltaproteobacteria bacterium]|nr:laccase domain-containing protein [Deltaproteobacteria bacterium]